MKETHQNRRKRLRRTKASGVQQGRDTSRVLNRNESPYQPLDRERKEIRLLLLKAGFHYQCLRCELRQAFLDQDPKPEYETTSYAWGDANDTRPITLNGARKRIPATAAAALRAMRLPKSDRILWIDSVCIDQSDLTERGHQVALMYEIFSNTHQNLIWLGESDEETAAALDLMGVVSDDARAQTENFTKFRETVITRNGRWKKSSHTLPPDLDLRPLLRIYERPWFSRLWVTQEAALSPSSICIIGSHLLPLDDVLKVAVWILHSSDDIPHHVFNHAGLIAAVTIFDVVDRAQGYFWRKTPKKGVFARLLLGHRYLDAAEPHDHVYGLLGLHQQLAGLAEIPSLLAPDYDRPIAEVMRDATFSALMEVDDQGFLFDELTPGWTREPGWPSWVPPWHIQPDYNENTYRFSSRFYAYNGLKQKSRSYPELSSPDTLLLSGFAVGTLPQTTSVMTQDILDDVERLRDFIQQCCALLPGADQAAEMARLAEVLTAGVDADQQVVDGAHALAFEKWNRYISEQKMIPPSPLELRRSGHPSEEGKLVYNYDRALWIACLNRRIFVAGQFHLGVGPKNMQIGDILAVVYMCQWPIILRPHGEYYELIGTCYAHGIMFGEAVQKHKEEGKEVTVFHIR